MGTDKYIHRWDIRLWLWVCLYSAMIFSSIPTVRGFQKFTYETAGKEFFIYSVLFVITAAVAMFLYILIFRLRARDISRYIWLLLCGGAYFYLAIILGKHPEESVHLIEYSLLALLVFRALNHRIRDWTVYLTSALMVALIGSIDEFMQWLTPGRIWDYKDLGINAAAGALLLFAVHKIIKPDSGSRPVEKFSVRLLAGTMTLDLILLGLFLSNTPETVNVYTSAFKGLSWLRNEEPMTKHINSTIFFNIKTVWSFIVITLAAVWISAGLWERKINSA